MADPTPPATLLGVPSVADEVVRRLVAHPDRAVGIRPRGVLMQPIQFASAVRLAVEHRLSRLVEMEAAGDGEFLIRFREAA